MSNKTILLIEDNPSDAALAERALRKARIFVDLVVAADGQEALDYLFGNEANTGQYLSEVPAVALLDLKIPKVSGLEVSR